MKEKLKRQKIVVAMSGGVDSSVAAALLKEAGDFEVIGVFMKFWLAPDKNGLKGRWNRCCSPEAEKRARLVASRLEIPFYVLNFENEFKKKIVDYFLNGYKKGITPNPCVVCNKEIKFGLLLKKARQLGAKFIATGHYARLEGGETGVKLMRSKDKNKDQSYFLWRLNQQQLKHVLFPVGGYTKTEVKEMAKKFKLPLSGVLESQEICFVRTTTNDFLRCYLKEKPGKIVDTKGKIIGEHQGLWFYTIGQRRGINLAQGPFYVVDKNLKKNLLIVSKNKNDLYKKDVILKNVNWLSGRAPKLPVKIRAKIRYRHKPGEALVYKTQDAKYKLQFKKSQRAVTPGQSVVFYSSAEASAKADRRNEVLGGGLISS